jgi:hypothetical protein
MQVCRPGCFCNPFQVLSYVFRRIHTSFSVVDTLRFTKMLPAAFYTAEMNQVQRPPFRPATLPLVRRSNP